MKTKDEIAQEYYNTSYDDLCTARKVIVDTLFNIKNKG